MLKLLFKQTKNLLREFGPLHRLQLLIVLAVVSAYLVNRGVDILIYLENHTAFTHWQLAALALHGYIAVLFLSSPFILLYLTPRQKELLVFYPLPLSNKQLFTVLGYYFQKYQALTFFVFLIPGIALTILNPAPGGVLLLSIAFSFAAFLLFHIFLFSRSASPAKFLQLSFAVFLSHTIISALLFFCPQIIFIWLFDMLFLIAIFLISFRNFTKPVNSDLAILYPLTAKIYQPQKGRRFSFSAIPRFLPAKLQMLFNVNFLSVWRNPRHRRLKIFTLLFYLVVLSILKTTISGDVYMWLTIAGMAFIYLHYSNYFNRKYVLPEPEWYFLTLPNRYRQIWTAKFLAESVFILMLFICHWLFLLFWGVSFSAQLHLLGLLLLFSFFTVSAMLNFQILFYDDPRLGGYAYHFMIILILVMSINYHLVGPLLGLFLLVLNFYKSYKYFNA